MFDLLLDRAQAPATDASPIPDSDFAPNEVPLGFVLAEQLERVSAQAASWLAEKYLAVWNLAEASRDAGAGEFMVEEVRAALLLTRRAADDLVEIAYGLCERLPMVWQALARGDIDDARARTIVKGLQSLDTPHARGIADLVLEDAPDLTTGQLRARMARLVVEFDPEAADERYEAGLLERKVMLTANPDGTANVHALNLPADRANAVVRKISVMARRLPRDDRTPDQKRADVFIDLLDGSTGGSKRAQVDIRVDLTTLMGLDDKAAEMPGWGPITAELARRVVAAQPDATWRATAVDGVDVVATSLIRRRPNAALRRLVETEAGRCTYPGCRAPANDCDIDHIQDHAKNGLTTKPNLEPLCRHDHMVKSKGGWKVKRRGSSLEWTSPLGLVYDVQAQAP